MCWWSLWRKYKVTYYFTWPFIIGACFNSAGKYLINLYTSPAIQSYLNGTSAKEIHQSKKLYQHATLRKKVQ